MMGHKATLKGGDEWDALTRAKRYYHFRPGVRRRIKARFNRRVRKMAKVRGDATR